jgi:hypothetical protein
MNSKGPPSRSHTSGLARNAATLRVAIGIKPDEVRGMPAATGNRHRTTRSMPVGVVGARVRSSHG